MNKQLALCALLFTIVNAQYYTFISSGVNQVYSKELNDYILVPYCGISSPVMITLNDNGLWFTNTSCTEIGTNLWKITTQSPFLRECQQVSVILPGSFQGYYLENAIFTINETEWLAYADFMNNISTALQNVVLNTRVSNAYTFLTFLNSSRPDLNFSSPTLAQDFLIDYATTNDPVKQTALLLQINTWAEINNRYDITFNPAISSLVYITATFVVNLADQYAGGLRQVFGFW